MAEMLGFCPVISRSSPEKPLYGNPGGIDPLGRMSCSRAGLTLKQQAVLFRASHHSGLLEIELTRRNIPFVKFGGLKFVDAAHVKDLLAVLRFAENPRDRISGFRVVQLVPGVGPGSAQRVLDYIITAADPFGVL